MSFQLAECTKKIQQAPMVDFPKGPLRFFERAVRSLVVEFLRVTLDEAGYEMKRSMSRRLSWSLSEIA